MTPLSEIDLTNVAQMYSVANTPLFLLRKLRDDRSVNDIASRFTGDHIVNELRNSVAHEPATVVDYVRPYAYLVALAKKPDDTYLRAVSQIPNTDKWDWFDYLRRVLLQTFIPTFNESASPKPKTTGRDALSSATVSCTEVKMP